MLRKLSCSLSGCQSYSPFAEMYHLYIFGCHSGQTAANTFPSFVVSLRLQVIILPLIRQPFFQLIWLSVFVCLPYYDEIK